MADKALPDAEKALKHELSKKHEHDCELIPQKGYGAIAYKMAENGRDYAIFRKFGQLSALTLLGLQADLLDLKEKFNLCCEYTKNEWLENHGNNQSGLEHNGCLDSFSAMREKHELHHKPLPDNELCPYCLLMDMRRTLKEYHETILRMVQIEGLEKPSQHAMESWHEMTYDARQLWPDFLQEEEFFTWYQPKGLKDLVSIQPPESVRDPFVESMSGLFFAGLQSLGRMYHFVVIKKCKRTKVDKTRGPARPPDSKLLRQYERWQFVTPIAAFAATLIAALYPVLSIWILYSIHHTLVRIYALIGLTILFAFALRLTGAKTVDVFSVAAAFAAVEVVFVGSATNS